MSDLAVRGPTSTDLAGRLSNDQVKAIANTDFVPKGYRGNLAAIAACIYTGRELGLGDLEALRSINVIDGRPSLSAELMVKLVRARGHSIRGKFAPATVTVFGRRADNGDEMEVEWTTEMAARAGLAEKQNWKRYPEAMLWARAVSQLCRMLFPDCLRGLSHTDDEVEMSAEERVEEAVTAGAVPAEAGPVDAEVDVIEQLSALAEPEPSFEERAEAAQRSRAARGTRVVE